MQMLRGRFEAIADKFAFGWAYDDGSPNSALEVELHIDKKFVAANSANLYRNDLEQAHIGAGYHGFAVEIPSYLQDGELHEIEIRCRAFADQNIENHTILSVIPFGGPLSVPFSNEEIESILFDAEYYVKQAGPTERPLQHYRNIGWKLGYDPSVLFSTNYYVKNAKHQIMSDPITDFCSYGSIAWPEVHPLLNVREYLQVRPDLVAHKLHPLVHFLTYGWKENVRAFRLFDAEYYRSQFPSPDSVFNVIGGEIVHYLEFGFIDGKKPHPLFDPIVFARLAKLPKNIEPLKYLVEKCLGFRQSPNKAGVPSAQIEASIIVLNLNKSLITLQCLFFLSLNTDRDSLEVIVFDNGSTDDEFKILAAYGMKCRLIRSDRNLGFGEGNNVAAEAANGTKLIFINNDTFVLEGWLEPLLSSLEEEGTGGVGPKFFHPNGNIQEAGGFIFDDGTVHQRGRGLPSSNLQYENPEFVTYVSPAAFAVRKDLFLDVLGFDLMWDPAFYEGVDLSLKIQALGYKIKYEPRSKVVHLEGSTSLDPSLELRGVVEINKLKFVQRWQNTLVTGLNTTNLNFSLPKYSYYTPRGNATLALFTPYPLGPGGGERFILSIAHALKDEYDCVLFMPRSTSRVRLLTMARELNLKLDHVRCLDWAERGNYDRPDVFVSMGNEVIPSAEPIGKRNFYVCQFPFPISPADLHSNWGKINGYDAVILYSSFACRAFLNVCCELDLPISKTYIVHPPVEMVGGTASRSAARKIIHVGRFHPGGHCKRQDVMIDLFRELVGITDLPLEMHFAGGLGSDDLSRDYFSRLKHKSEGLNIFFHPNVSGGDLHKLYLEGDLYWHVTGINDDVELNPEKFEHFGITIVEAMSAGCIPIVLGYGGPAEIVEDGVNGFHVNGGQALVSRTLETLRQSPQILEEYRKSAIKRANNFTYDNFAKSLKIMQLL